MATNEKYFVSSNGDAPERMFFDEKRAFDCGDTYLDAFDENSDKVASWKRVKLDDGSLAWTEDF